MAALRRLLAPLVGTLAILVWAAFPAGAADTLVQISSDPFTNPDSQHQTEVEPDSFAAGQTVVSAFQVGRFFNGGASDIGFGTSLDGGHTWQHGFLPATTVNSNPPGPFARASDASVAFDARDGVWLISYLGIEVGFPNAPVDVMVSRSTDGGRTFGAPVAVAKTGHFLDKNWTVCDNTPSSPHFGNCYTEFDDNTQGDLEQMSTSTDGGLTWGAGKPTADGAHGLGGQPLVQPNGTVVVPYVGLDSPFFAFTISSFSSGDGGASWSAQTLVSEADFHQPNGGIRAGIPLPSAEIDKSGRIYVTWSDCRFESSCGASDLVLSTTDDGTTWSPVHRIPIGTVGDGGDRFVPGLAVDNTTSGNGAHLALAFYDYPVANCTPATCQLEVSFITSVNGGRTWSDPEKLAGPMQVGWLPATTQGRMFGDYISTSIPPGADRGAAPLFCAATAPTGTVFDETTDTVPERVAGVGGGNRPIGSEPRVAGPQPANARPAAPPTVF